MKHTTLATVAEVAGGRLIGEAQVEVHDIGLDSTALEEGALFAALPGTRAHGASYAASTTASAILTDEAGLEILQSAGESRPVIVVEDIRSILGTVSAEIYGHPTSQLTVLGVTGTSGKTTTSYLLEAGLLEAGHSVGLIGTTGTRINREPVPTKLTTPEAPKLQQLFARMLAEGVTHVVMEVSSHALELGRVQGTQFAVAGFTNLSQDHLDFHPTMEDYFHAKTALFAGSPRASAASRAVICIDDQWGQRMASIAEEAGHPVTRVTTKAADDAGEGITATQVSVDPTGAQKVELTIAGTAHSLDLPLPGEFNIANAALATGIAVEAGVDVEPFLRGVAGVAVPGRMERIAGADDFIAVVDYAHKPAAVAAVLDTLREQLGDSGRIGIVIGAGGDRDHGKRPIMGAAAAERADLVVVTDDNPRSEEPAPIRAAILEGAREALAQSGREQSVELREVGSRAAAIDEAIAWAQPGDAVIVVGKGHEVGQIVGDKVHHFDDREEVARALKERAESH